MSTWNVIRSTQTLAIWMKMQIRTKKREKKNSSLDSIFWMVSIIHKRSWLSLVYSWKHLMDSKQTTRRFSVFVQREFARRWPNLFASLPDCAILSISIVRTDPTPSLKDASSIIRLFNRSFLSIDNSFLSKVSRRLFYVKTGHPKVLHYVSDGPSYYAAGPICAIKRIWGFINSHKPTESPELVVCFDSKFISFLPKQFEISKS